MRSIINLFGEYKLERLIFFPKEHKRFVRPLKGLNLWWYFLCYSWIREKKCEK
jgi:hypothetical protein